MPKIIKKGLEKNKVIFFRVDKKTTKKFDAVSIELIGDVNYRLLFQKLVNDFLEKK